jgi:NADH:ubiquinone oxidoreductase subunit 4 (subunit M)
VTHSEETSRLHVPLVMQGAVVVLALGVFFVGLYPQPIFDLTDSVSAVLFAG